MVFNWTTVAVVLLNVLVGGVLVQLIKRKPSLDKIANEREANLLSERAKEMEEMRERISKLENTLDRERVRRDAERAVERHKIKNLQACFDAMVLMMKAAPEKASEIIEHIERMRAEQLKSEALESAAIHEALLKGLEQDE